MTIMAVVLFVGALTLVVIGAVQSERAERKKKRELQIVARRAAGFDDRVLPFRQTEKDGDE